MEVQLYDHILKFENSRTRTIVIREDSYEKFKGKNWQGLCTYLSVQKSRMLQSKIIALTQNSG